MLKIKENYIIITSEMRWNLMHPNVLVSTAMISSIWEKQHKDSLDIMLPFLKYAISKETSIGHAVDVQKVIDVFQREFGYEKIPHNVMLTMLNRLSPTVLTKRKGTYTLVASLDNETADFEKRRTLYKDHREQVGAALSTFMNENIHNLSLRYDNETALSALTNFFVVNGLVVAQTPEQLSLLRKDKDGKVNYCIGRFLVEEHKKGSALFDYITDMVKGFFVSTAISFQPENATLSQAKFKNLRCYLDTRVILDALGLRLVNSQKAALELFDMLRGEQATICCFEHTIAEVRDIIKAYKNSLLNPGNTVHTLERWDEQNYTADRVSRYLVLLEKKIEELGIEIVPSPTNIDSKVRGLNTVQFKKSLKEQVRYGSFEARKHDILSVLGVMHFRAGRVAYELEKCGHIFVTTNIPLIGVTNTCLYDADAGVSPAIADTTMSAIVWFKCSNSHKDYPLHKLIENALLALEPSHTLLKEFYTVVDQLQADGGVSSEEAAIIRTDIQIRRELNDIVCGDSSQIDKDTVNKMRERLRDRYIGDSKKATEENYQHYLEQKLKNEKALGQIVDGIETCGDLWRNRTDKTLNNFAKITLVTLFLLFVGFAITAFVISASYWIGAVVMLVADAVGFYDLLRGKKQVIRKVIKRVSNYVADEAMAKKRKEFSKVIDTLTQS